MGVYFSTFNFLSLVVDTWKEYRQYREANPGPRTLKSWVRFGGKYRPGFVWKEKMDVKRSKAKKYIQKKEKNKDDKNDNKNKVSQWSIDRPSTFAKIYNSS